MSVMRSYHRAMSHWSVMAEVVVAVVTVVDMEHQCVSAPGNRTVEVAEIHIETVLSRCEHPDQTAVASARALRPMR